LLYLNHGRGLHSKLTQRKDLDAERAERGGDERSDPRAKRGVADAVLDDEAEEGERVP